MKRAVSVSLGSSQRDKRVEAAFGGETVIIERIGTDGDAEKFKRLLAELDGKVGAFGIGGVDLYIRLGKKEYPLRAALKLVEGVKHTPLVDGRGLKHTLERRVFELARPMWQPDKRFKQAFVPVALDRVGLAQAASEAAERVVFGDLMVALGLPLPITGLQNYLRIARILMPFVSRFPLSMLFYGSGGAESEPKYQKQWAESDLLAGDFLFMRKYLPPDLRGKTIITNTTTDDNLKLMQERGVDVVVTTTPRYEGRSFGTNMMEAALTAYADKGRALTEEELNGLIDELGLRPDVTYPGLPTPTPPYLPLRSKTSASPP